LQAEKTRIERLKGSEEENNKVYATRLQQEMIRLGFIIKLINIVYNDKSGRY